MAGMLQILTYLLAFYLVIKGLEFVQLALTSARPNRGPAFALAFIVLAMCVVGATYFVAQQDQQAAYINRTTR